jgi:hypothetical protein
VPSGNSTRISPRSSAASASASGFSGHHRDDADDVEREPAAQLAREEIVESRDRTELRQEPERHQRHDGERIEIGVVIAGEHGRSVLRQTLAVAHGQAQRDQDHRPHHHGEEQKP